MHAAQGTADAVPTAGTRCPSAGMRAFRRWVRRGACLRQHGERSVEVSLLEVSHEDILEEREVDAALGALEGGLHLKVR